MVYIGVVVVVVVCDLRGFVIYWIRVYILIKVIMIGNKMRVIKGGMGKEEGEGDVGVVFKDLW